MGYQSEGCSGLDMTAGIDDKIVLNHGDFAVVPLGVCLEIPPGYEGQLRGRSGFAAKSGIGVVNGVGTIDSDYRGEIAAILINFGRDPFTIEPGMRVAQLVFTEICRAQLTAVDGVGYSERGTSGFGSTGDI